MDRNPRKVVRAVMRTARPSLLLMSSMDLSASPLVSSIPIMYSESMWRSSVEPTTIMMDGTMTVRTLMGIPTRTMKAKVQRTDVPAVSMGIMPALKFLRARMRVITKTETAMGAIRIWSLMMFSAMARRLKELPNWKRRSKLFSYLAATSSTFLENFVWKSGSLRSTST